MKRDIIFVGMDVIKEMDNLYSKANTKPLPKEAQEGYDYAKTLLEEVLNNSLDNTESCIVHLNGIEESEEFTKSDLFKYLDKNGFNLPECI